MTRNSEQKAIHEELARLQICIDNVQDCINDPDSKLPKDQMHNALNDLRHDMAWCLMDADEPVKALEFYDLIPWELYAMQKYVGMSRALTEIGQYEEAERLIMEGLKEMPDSFPLWNNLGNLYHKQRDFLRALKYFEKALESDPEDEGVLTNKGNALYGLTCYEQSLELFQVLAARYPDNPHHQSMLGWCYLNLGYPEEAAQYFKKHINTDNETTDTYDGLYWAYWDMNLRHEALDIIQKGMIKYPTEDSQLYIDIGYAYCHSGWADEARDILTKALKIFPDDEGIKDLIRQIDEDMDDPEKGNKPPKSGFIMIMINQKKRGQRCR